MCRQSDSWSTLFRTFHPAAGSGNFSLPSGCLTKKPICTLTSCPCKTIKVGDRGIPSGCRVSPGCSRSRWIRPDAGEWRPVQPVKQPPHHEPVAFLPDDVGYGGGEGVPAVRGSGGKDAVFCAGSRGC